MGLLHGKEILTNLAKEFWIIRKRPWLFKSVVACFVFTLLFGVAGFFYLYFYTGNLKDATGRPLDWNKLGKGDFLQTSYVYARNHEPIGRFFYQIRDPIKFGEVPDLLKEGFIAAEDQRFYSRLNFGIDVIAITRAGIFNFLHSVKLKYGPKSGASGVAQQAARLFYADEVPEFKNREQSIGRKIKEAQVAIQLVKRYPKDKVLEGFLNNIYFGHGVNGVAEAYRFYFGKDVRNEDPSLREVAILVSLNKSPLKFCPIYHEPEMPGYKAGTTHEAALESAERYQKELAREMTRLTLARDRYNWVLRRMEEDGYIGKKEYEEASFTKDDPPKLGLLHVTPIKNPDFGYNNRVVKEMLFMNGYEEEAISYSGGLRVETSYDSTIQNIVSGEVRKQLAELNKWKKDGEEKIEGAAVVLDVKTGRVLAMAGGHDFAKTQLNRALVLRSPGSAFKVFTYAVAIDSGKSFDDKICNCPFSMKGGNGKTWSPRNFEERNPVPYGYIDLSTGLIRSVNLATLNLARELGVKSVIEMAHRMGIWGNRNLFRDSDGKVWFRMIGAREEDDEGLQPYLPTAIGASDVSLLELASAFGVFARGGTYIKPSVILQVKDSDGNILYRAAKPEGKRVLSEATAEKMAILLRAVTKVGTARAAMRDIEQQVAVKTGTSNGPRDLLTVGYTPEYVIGIRFGYDIPQPIKLPEYMKAMTGDPKLQVSGGWVVGPVFRRIVDRVYRKRSKVEFPKEVEDGLKKLLEKYHSPEAR